MTLEEMRKALAECRRLIESVGVEMNAAISCVVYAEILRDAIRWREMMTERRPEELVEGKYYFVFQKSVSDGLILQIWRPEFFTNDVRFIGPIPIPEVTP